MKKLISLLLALVMVFSFATVAFAEEGDGAGATTTPTTQPTALTFTKNYVDASGEATSVFPTEELTFTVTADKGNPDASLLPAVEAENKVTVASNAQQISITFPEYTKVGTYTYTVKENTGSTQGVTYSSAEYTVIVYVTWNGNHTALENKTVVYLGEEKVSGDGLKFDNTYNLGTLKVTKKVTGNLGDQTKKFDVTVNFSSDNALGRDFSYSGSENGTVTLAKAEGAEKYTASVALHLKHDDTVTFENIPAGVSYTVTESDYTTGEKNGENGYDAASYKLNDGGASTTAVTGDISAGETDAVEITNNKGVKVETGITLDSVPFILILAVCAGAVVLFVVKKRRSAEF